MGRQSAFLSDNQPDDSDTQFRLKPEMADTSLTHFAKTTEEDGSPLSFEIVLGNFQILKY